MHKQTALCVAIFGLQSAMAANINVPAGGNLQTALNSAQPGDTVTLAAGATYVGHFYPGSNPGPQWITIQSSAMSSLPAPGNRVSNTQSAAMPKLMSPDGAAVLQFTSGANYYHIIGVEFLPAPGVYAQDVIQVGTAGETSVNQLPHDLDFDRDYIHGDSAAGGKRGIALNGASTTVENCYISAFFSTWQDTQALAGWNGPGPFQITNNYLEAGTETVAFGGAQPAIQGVIPSDISIQNNYLFKPLSWEPGSSSYAGVPIWVKNHLELKNAQRVTFDGNTLENNWVGADQRGYAFMFDVRTLGNSAPWSVVTGIKITNNIIKHSGGGVSISGHDSDGSGSSGNVLIQNNLWEDISSSWGDDGHLFGIFDGVQGVTIDHNTAFQTGFIMGFDVGPSYNVSYTNNISLNGWGVTGDNAGGGTPALNAYDIGGTFSNNVLIGAPAALYPAKNFFPSSVDQVGFVDYADGNFQLASNSPYKGAGTNSSDIGASLPTAQSALAIPTGWLNIVSKMSGKCLDVTGMSTAPSALLQQWTCWGGDNQKFQFTSVQGGYEITIKNSGFQVDVGGGPQAIWDGALINQWPYWGGSNEIWQVNPTSDGYVKLNPLSSGKCMNVSGASVQNGALIQQWICVGGDNEKWTLVPTQ